MSNPIERPSIPDLSYQDYSINDAIAFLETGAIGFTVYISVGQVAREVDAPDQIRGVVANIPVPVKAAIKFIEAAYGERHIRNDYTIRIYTMEGSIFVGEEAYLL